METKLRLDQPDLYSTYFEYGVTQVEGLTQQKIQNATKNQSQFIKANHPNSFCALFSKNILLTGSGSRRQFFLLNMLCTDRYDRHIFKFFFFNRFARAEQLQNRLDETVGLFWIKMFFQQSHKGRQQVFSRQHKNCGGPYYHNLSYIM